MSNFSREYSRETLIERRRKLRRQRGWKVLRTIWRTLVVSGMAGGLVWSLTLRFWVIQSPDQVEIQGTALLSPDTIRDLLALHYPLSLLQVQPQKLVHILESSAPIAQAAVTREVIPPRLMVQVQERKPVAQASLAADTSPSQRSGQAANPRKEVWGVLDERGFWIPLEQFTNLKSESELPKLKVLGMRPDLRQAWTELYQIIHRSSLDVTQIDWRDPNNLILRTELGTVYFGSYGPQFAQQLEALDRLRNLPKHSQFSKKDYIDLRDPSIPYLHLPAAATPSSPKPNTP